LVIHTRRICRAAHLRIQAGDAKAWLKVWSQHVEPYAQPYDYEYEPSKDITTLISRAEKIEEISGDYILDRVSSDNVSFVFDIEDLGTYGLSGETAGKAKELERELEDLFYKKFLTQNSDLLSRLRCRRTYGFGCGMLIMKEVKTKSVGCSDSYTDTR